EEELRLDLVERALAARPAREQRKALHRDRSEPRQLMALHERAQAVGRRAAEARQGHVRRELAAFGLEPEAHQRRLDAVAQLHQRRVLVDADPQHARLLALAELSDAAELKIEALAA